MRRGFLRCRKRDSDLPFWNRKILLSPRTYSLPCNEEHRQNLVFSPILSARTGTIAKTAPSTILPTPGLVWRHLRIALIVSLLGSEAGNVAVGRSRGNGKSVPCQGRSAGRRKYRRTFSLWRLVVEAVVVGVASSELQDSGSIFAKFFGAGCADRAVL